MDVAYQPPLFMGFSRQRYWNGLPFPSPGDPPNPGIKPRSPTLQANALPSEPPGKSEGVERPNCRMIIIAISPLMDCIHVYIFTWLPAWAAEILGTLLPAAVNPMCTYLTFQMPTGGRLAEGNKGQSRVTRSPGYSQERGNLNLSSAWAAFSAVGELALNPQFSLGF